MSVSCSEREKERIAANIAVVKEHIPEIVEDIKQLHAFGMIDGWRNVVRAGPIDQEPLLKGVVIFGPFKTGREFSEFGKKDRR